MRNSNVYLLPLLLFTAIAGSLAGSGCRKENGIDNNNVIRTPYGVYMSDKLGALYGTNDGKAFKTVYFGDGYTPRGICTSGPNILWVKNNLHVSADNGLNFNPAIITTKFINPPAGVSWTSMMLDFPSWGDVYVANSTTGNGVSVSHNHGETWEDGQAIFSGVTIQSFTQLKNGKAYAIDNTGSNVYECVSKLAPWTTVGPVNTPLPPGSYQLSHINNALVAADVTGSNGIYSSTNGGLDWVQYAGMPTNQEIFSVYAPFDQVLLAGCDSAGLFRLNGSNFVPSNNGLAPFTKVYGIVGKQDMYKNGKIIQYVYIATNNGLFRSEDLGQNWTLIRAGDFRAIY